MMLEVIDLSLVINQETKVIMEDSGFTDPPIRFETWATIDEQGYRVTALHMGPHAGTHCDVSSHYIKGGRTITDVPVSNFVGWAVVLSSFNNSPVTPNKLEQYREYIENKDNVVVVLNTNKDEPLTDDARKTLASWLPSLIIGGEGWDIDINYRDSDFFHRADIPMILNPDYKALASVENGDFICALPIKFESLEAAPVRLVAIKGLKEL